LTEINFFLQKICENLETDMKHQQLKANLILLTTAAIWGLAFTAQKVAAGQMGAFTYTGIRFALGSLTVLPFYLVRRSRMRKEDGLQEGGNLFESLMAGISSGIILFIAVSLQQLGLVETEAGKAAFITALYIIFVPLFGIFLKQKVKINGWVGAVLALTGLYLLSVTGSMTISRGDVHVLLCACFWAVHIYL
jgi:drug/metabolite transporter (DMT)-like permease